MKAIRRPFGPVTILAVAAATAASGVASAPRISSAADLATAIGDAGTLPAFSITKDTNQNVVKYDIRLRPDCSIDADDPLDIYWITRDGKGRTKREGLNLIEKGLYGFSLEKPDKKDPHTLLGEVKALKSKGERFAVRIQIEPAFQPSTLVRSGGAPATQQAGVAARGGRCIVRTFVGGPKLPEEVQVNSLRLEQFEGSTPKAIGIEGTAATTKKPRNYTVRIG